MQKTKVYFDTSTPSSFYDTEAPEQTAMTRLFWEEYLREFRPYISEITIQEIQRTKELEKRQNILKLVNKCDVLKVTTEVENLAEDYLKGKLVPRSHAIDALHIAAPLFTRSIT